VLNFAGADDAPSEDIITGGAFGSNGAGRKIQHIVRGALLAAAPSA
jgi:hypothetical protein